MKLIDKHIAYVNAELRPVLLRLRSRIQQLDHRIVERATPAQRIVYEIDRIFAEVKVQKKRILVRVFDTNIPDPQGILHHIEHAERNGWQHTRELRLENMAMLEAAMVFIEASLRRCKPSRVNWGGGTAD